MIAILLDRKGLLPLSQMKLHLSRPLSHPYLRSLELRSICMICEESVDYNINDPSHQFQTNFLSIYRVSTNGEIHRNLLIPKIHGTMGEEDVETPNEKKYWNVCMQKWVFPFLSKYNEDKVVIFRNVPYIFGPWGMYLNK